MPSRAQANTIGIVLLTAIVVVTVGIAGVFIFDGIGGDDATRADLVVVQTNSSIAIEHNGGESVPFSELTILVEGNERLRPEVNQSGLSRGDDDDLFEAGERWVLNRPFDSDVAWTVRAFGGESRLPVQRKFPDEAVAMPPAEPSERIDEPPVAEIDVAGDAVVDDTVRFSAANSTDPDGGTLGYEWSFGDGESSFDAAPNHSYAETGTYTVRLTVTDDEGNIRSVTQEVEVEPKFVYGLNAGGPEVTYGDETYAADNGANENRTGSSNRYPNGGGLDDAIENTTQDELYQTERFGKGFGYELPVEDGTYRVTVMLAEIYWGGNGNGNQPRTFDVALEGETVLENVNIYDRVGHDHALELSFEVPVTDGSLDADFAVVGNDDNAKLSALKIERVGPAPEVVPDQEGPIVSVSQPSSGETIRGNTSYTIEWSATDERSNVAGVDIEYSIDGGEWQEIATNEPDDGEFEWNVSAVNTTNARVRVTATDGPGNSNSSATEPFTIDTDRPAVTDVEPNADAPTYTQGGENVTVSWNATDETTGVESLRVRIENRATGSVIAEAAPDPADGSAALAIEDGETEGNYSVVVEASDEAGNVGTATRTNAVVVDNTAPSVSISVPTDEAPFKGDEAISIEWDANDDVSGVDDVTLEYRVDGGSWNEIASRLSAAGSTDWTPEGISSENVQIRATATDRVGNAASDSTGAFTVDSESPTISSITPSADAPTYVQSGQDVTVSWDASDQTTEVEDVTVSIISDGTTVNSKTGLSGTGSTVFTAPSTEGNYSIVVEVIDEAGNTNTVERTNAVVVDDTPPTIEQFSGVTADPDTDIITIGNLELRDNEKLTRAEITVQPRFIGFPFDARTMPPIQLSSATESRSDITLETSISSSRFIQYDVTVTVYDEAGNSESRTVRAEKSGN